MGSACRSVSGPLSSGSRTGLGVAALSPLGDPSSGRGVGLPAGGGTLCGVGKQPRSPPPPSRAQGCCPETLLFGAAKG